MRSVLSGLIMSWMFALALTSDPDPSSTTETAATTKKEDGKRGKTKNLIKPSFIPYCTTRDVCKPACDCAIYEDCELLEMNADVRNRILIALNTARSVQSSGEPQASGMPKLIYDMELEEISKCWSARCENEYSECFRTPYYGEATQTVGLLPLDLKLSELPLDYWDRTIQIWLGEVRKTTAEVVSSLPAGKRGEEVHSYAQILADKIMRVGCAWSRLVPTGSNGEQPSLIFVCTYTPRGPRQGEAIYKTGKACTTCPDGYQCDYKEPFTFLCKETGMAEQKEVGAEQGAEQESRDSLDASMRSGEDSDYNAPFSDSPEEPSQAPPKQHARAAVSSATTVPTQSFGAIVFLCLVKSIY